ncbi:ArnT family glycosyltransferase [Bdellovibrio sp. HCB274]|uniref:ArnT family glycosyltransferase n=1 Tax=Bdellovibrio sp. HCB274 TaxID=3394361 RepID=UPI0039B5CF3D
MFSLIGRRIHIDEAVLAEPTYWLAKNGFLRSEGLRGWQGAEEHFFFTHKLYLYVGSLFVKLFGWSVYSIKATSLFYFLALVTAWSFVFKRLQASKEHFVVFCLLLLTNAHIYELSFVYRPEIAVAFYATLTFLCIHRFLHQNQKVFVLLAGVTAALAIGHHLNGVVVPGAACILLLWHRRIVPMLAFGCIATLGFLFHLMEVKNIADINMLIGQFKNMQDIGTGHFSFWHYPLNILNEQQRFLHSPKEIAFTLLSLTAIFFGRKLIWQKHKDLAIYTIAGILCLAIIAHGKDTKYLVLFMPFIVFMATESLPLAFKAHRNVLTALVVLFVVVQWTYNAELTFNKEHRPQEYSALIGDLPEGMHLLGPVYFVFDAVPKYRYQTFISYQFQASHKHFEMTAEGLNAALDQHDINAVIFDKEFGERFQVSESSFPKFELRKHEQGANPLWFFVRK